MTHRPVTDAQAEEWRSDIYPEPPDETDEELRWKMRADRLLADRAAAMEILEGFVQVMREEYSIGDPVERATDRASLFAQARALIAAVKGE